jgi:hypothetical protein
MPWLDVIWNYEPGGNVEHLADNGVTPKEAEYVLHNPLRTGESDSSGRPICAGFTKAGRQLVVAFEWVDSITVYPVSAYEVD